MQGVAVGSAQRYPRKRIHIQRPPNIQFRLVIDFAMKFWNEEAVFIYNQESQIAAKKYR